MASRIVELGEVVVEIRSLAGASNLSWMFICEIEHWVLQKSVKTFDNIPKIA